MPLTIKNERVSALATPVEVLESRLAELNPSTRRAGMAAQLVEIGRNCAAAAPDEWLKRNFDLELYGEHGMPR